MRTRRPARRTLLVLALILAVTVQLTAASTASSATRIYCASKDGSRYVPKVAPSRCTAFGPGGSFGGGVNLASLDWTGWGGPTASAKGIERGFHQPLSNIPVSVKAYRRKRDCTGRLTYTRLRATSTQGTTRVRLQLCRRKT